MPDISEQCEPKTASDWRIRAGRETDLAYVFNSWLKCDRYSAAAIDEGPGYYGAEKRRIRKVLERAKLVVACDPVDEGAILGWAVLEPAIVYYVHVRKEARGLGIARELLASVSSDAIYTHKPITRTRIPQGWSYSRDPNHW